MGYRLRSFIVTGTGALSFGLAMPSAHAAGPLSWYVGASSNDTHVEVYRGLGWEAGGEERGGSLFAGWQANHRFGVEFAALRASSLQWTEYFTEIPGYMTSHTTFDTTALQATGVVTFHWGNNVEAYLKAGLAKYRIDGRQALDTLETDAALTRAVDASGSDHLLGAGVRFKATPKWRVRLEYQYFGIDRDFLGVPSGDDPSIDTFAVGIDYRLGRRAATVNALR